MAVDNVVYKVVGLTVFILITATCLIPVVQDSIESQHVVGLNSTNYYALASSSETVTIEDDNGTITVNGYTLDTGDTSRYKLLAFADDFFIAFRGTNNNMYVTSAQTENSTGTTNTITIDADTISFGETTISYTGQLYYAADSGDLALFDYRDENLKINPDSQLTVFFNSSVSALSTTVYALAKGTYDDLETLFCFDNNEDVFTGADFSIAGLVDSQRGYFTMTSDSRLDAVYHIEGADDVISYSNTVTIIAPVEYSYLTDNDLSNASLLSIIPLMVIIAAVMIAVGMLRGRS